MLVYKVGAKLLVCGAHTQVTIVMCWFYSPAAFASASSSFSCPSFSSFAALLWARRACATHKDKVTT